MNVKNSHDQAREFLSRRDFLRQGACASLGLTGLVSMLTQLRVMTGAMAQETTVDELGYRALVCVFLSGGNDCNNMIVPVSQTDYDQYAAVRGSLALPKDDLLALAPKTYSDGVDYGLHPGLTGVKSLFDQEKVAILANVGTLVAPTTREQYLTGSVEVPAQLFSHSDQSVQWQSSVSDKPFTTGWGGRVADLLHTLNENAEVSMSISLGGTNSYQVGTETTQYAVDTEGSISFQGYGNNYSNALNEDGTFKSTNAGKRLKAFLDIMNLEPANLMQQAFAGKVNRAYENDRLLTAALADVNIATPFPDSNAADQLKMVAQLIAAHDKLSQQRQIFFVEVKGYDTHADQVAAHGDLMTELSEALKAFYDATVEIGEDKNVTAFTSSDFGRTYTPNSGAETAGADHAWGSHAFIMGGAVKGGDIYGKFPELVVDGPDDVNGDRGRWIPSTSVDEYSATLAKWIGVSDSNMDAVFPNISRFNNRDLGFLES
ncbi:MAG: hypothetical protein ACI9R3_000563 [Verrucomicrobiales bacterium]|jgi:uncharacterized protein (DUF1501 family)